MSPSISPELLMDPKFYLENLCKIKTKDRKFVPFVLNDAQKHLYNALVRDMAKRVIILKARQLGFSTAVCAFFYHDTVMNPGTVSMIIGYNREMTAELLEKIKLFYSTTPKEFRPTIQYNSRYEMSFPKIQSKIIVLPSTETVGRGYTPNNLLCTELAFWDKADEKMASLEASVPIDGRIIVESTPNGIGNTYHEMWAKEDNGYTKLEYGWWWGYSEEQIETIRKRINNPQKFSQEYGLEFLTSGRMVFDRDALLRQRKNILRVGDPVKWMLPDGEKDGRVFVHDNLRIYHPPVAGRQYVFGVDTSEGVDGGDYSAVTVFDRRTGEEVAFYRGLMAPDQLAQNLDKWGRYYNKALMVVEINNHGLTTVTELKRLLYPSLYFRPAKFDTLSQEWSEKMGWRTTPVTKPYLIDELNKALRDDVLTLHSKETLDEMLTYVYNENNEMEPMTKKYHDDCIMATGISFQGFKVLYDKPLTQIDYQKVLPSSGY